MESTKIFKYSLGIEIIINNLGKKSKNYLPFVNYICRILRYVMFDYFNLDRFDRDLSRFL